MERRTVARWLLVSALACFGLLWAVGSAHAEQTVQGTQSSTDSTATTGGSTGQNSSNFTAGPSASGSTGASANQIGSNDASVSQSGTAETGDPVAGAQVTGAVADDVTVQNQNSATNPVATTGTTGPGATVVNDAEVTVGPNAEVTGTGDAMVSQVGDNTLAADQFAAADTGDAVSGSQVTGIVGGGEHTIQNQNTASCEDPGAPGICAATGSPVLDAALAVNDLTPQVGPNADTPEGVAQAGQVGDNDATFTQAVEAGTGDALFGSQVNGVVGGSATVQVQNNAQGNAGTASRPEAVSGGALAVNSIGGIPGADPPITLAPVTIGPEASSLNGPAQSTQNGSNTVAVTQTITVGTGDALAGSQVTGAVGDQGGFLEVQSQQASEDNDAVVGSGSGTLFVGGNAYGLGPIILPGRGFSVGPVAESGGDVATSSQVGDNDVTVTQIPDLASSRSGGDALAGSQVTGAVGHEDVTVQNQNTATANTATVSSGTGSPISGTFAGVTAGPEATGFPAVPALQQPANPAAESSASQVGDNTVAITQILGSTGGDAVAGGQVTGVVAAGSTVTVQNQNTATDNAALLENSFLTGGGNVAEAFLGPKADATDVANATQTGDNDAAVTQIWVTDKGDAVGGAQVTGVVAGDDSSVTVQNQNTATNNDAQSANVIIGGGVVVDVPNVGPVPVPGNSLLDASVQGGPVADADEATASQIGDNVATVGQTSDNSTGDAVGNAQVTGVVAGSSSDVTIQDQNTADAADSVVESGSFESGFAGFSADPVHDANVDLGATAFAGTTAQATQNGDNVADVRQTLGFATGDAVNSSQVTGAVAGANSEVTVQNQNACAAAGCGPATSGEVFVEFGANDVELFAGAYAESTGGDANASQVGDNVAGISQTADASTGDALSGAQVTGVVAGAGSDVTVQNQNTAINGIATSGSIEGLDNIFDAQVGVQALADGTAQAEQIGDDVLTFSQVVQASGGDAVAGAQVTGVVGPEDATVQVQNSDTGSVADASFFGVLASNTATGDLGPVADGTDATTQQSGDVDFAGSQDLSVESGDAVAGAQVNGGVGSGGATTTESTTLGEGALGVV